MALKGVKMRALAFLIFASASILCLLSLSTMNINRQSHVPRGTAAAAQGHSRIYDHNTCPLALARYHLMGSDEELERANAFALDRGVVDVMQMALDPGSFRNRRVVLTGDSTIRQLSISLFCMAHSLGHWASDDSYHYGYCRDCDAGTAWGGLYYDARLRLDDGGEIIYNPHAGGVSHYFDGRSFNGLLTSEESWLKSCRDRAPFYVDLHKVEMTPGEWFTEYTPDNPNLEKIRLGLDDVIFFGGGHLDDHRSDNLQSISNLMQCMDAARAAGEDPGWPNIRYVRTTPQHFPGSTNGHYDKSRIEEYGQINQCLDHIEEDVHLPQELAILGENIDIVGKDLPVTDSWGSLHIHRKRNRLDCTHWLMPGLIDVFAAEVVKSVMELPKVVNEQRIAV